MERLGQKQRRFSLEIAKLVIWAYENGYELTQGDGYRDPRVFGKVGKREGYGRSRSNHKIRLAHDYNLFINGVYQRSTKAHKPIGLKWESMGEDHRWGGRYNDGNHYSFEYRGRQ